MATIMADMAPVEPHVLVFPYPAQGNVTPMLKLAQLLSLVGLRITFLNTEFIHRRMLRHSPALNRLSGNPYFRFRTIPDGFPEDHPRPFLQFVELLESMTARSREPLRDLLSRDAGRGDPDGWAPVTCVVADPTVHLTLQVAEEVGVPVIFFRTSGACVVWAYHCIPELVKGGELPFPDEADLDAKVVGVAGMESFLRRRDLPSFCRRAKSITDPSLQFATTAATSISRSRALILNTFEHLEGPALSHIRSQVCPITYALGPLHALLAAHNQAVPASFASAGLWEEDRSCMAWLNAQPHKSVVYISFGSITVMTNEELVEFWHGLVGSGHRFLWVMRPDLVGGESEELPSELEAAVRERGFLVKWAPQEEVSAHPAVGCFMTHSGWNSTLESIVAGVPMICWPFFADQQINSRFVGEVWRVGLDMKDCSRRSVVETMVRTAMEGETAEKLRRSAADLTELARRSTEEGGSSHKDFIRLIEHIKSFSLEAKNQNNSG